MLIASRGVIVRRGRELLLRGGTSPSALALPGDLAAAQVVRGGAIFDGAAALIEFAQRDERQLVAYDLRGGGFAVSKRKKGRRKETHQAVTIGRRRQRRASRPTDPGPRPRRAIRQVYVCRFVRYIATVAIEAVLEEMLRMPAEERAELVERLIDSLDDEIELSAEELAHLDEAIADADRAVEREELIPAEDVLAQMRLIS